MTLKKSLTSLLITAGLVIIAGMSEQSGGTLPKKVVSVPTNRKVVALTFDDGPHKNFTLRILDILSRAGIKATFFEVGMMVRQSPELLKAQIAAGHEVESHTYHHYNLTTLTDSEIQTEANQCRQEIERQGGNPVFLLRPPYGKYDDRVLRILNQNNYIVVLWSVYTCDYGCTVPEAIIERTVRQARPGSIILCHDGVEATVEALPELIRRLKQNGYEFVTVSDLIKKSYLPEGISLSEGMRLGFKG